MSPEARQALRAIGEALLLLADEAAAETKAAELLPIGECGLERATVRRLARAGRLEVVKLGRRSFVRRAELDALGEPEAVEQGLAERAAGRGEGKSISVGPYQGLPRAKPRGARTSRL